VGGGAGMELSGKKTFARDAGSSKTINKFEVDLLAM